MITLSSYSQVHGKVKTYSTSFCTYMSIIYFLEGVKFCHDDRPGVMFFESCLASEHVFMCAYPVEMHFMCTNSTLFLDFHLYVAFYKFELDIL